jgi:hypothetical protein
MTALLRTPDDQGHSKPPPTNRNNPLGDLFKPVSPANDNEGPWPLAPFVVVAYVIVAFTAMIAWVYLLGLTMLSTGAELVDAFARYVE